MGVQVPPPTPQFCTPTPLGRRLIEAIRTPPLRDDPGTSSARPSRTESNAVLVGHACLRPIGNLSTGNPRECPGANDATRGFPSWLPKPTTCPHRRFVVGDLSLDRANRPHPKKG